MECKERFIRALPGRLRIEVYGLKSNPLVAEYFTKHFQHRQGVTRVSACVETGRVLIQYKEQSISDVQVCEEIHLFEHNTVRYLVQNNEVLYGVTNSHDISSEQTFVSKNDSYSTFQKEAAVTVEDHEDLYLNTNFNWIPNEQSLNRIHTTGTPKIPTSLLVSVGALGVLGVKQFVSGRSALARQPIWFNISAVVSILTGYTFLRRGVVQFTQDRKWNTDLIFGTASLGLALVRENLVVLAGLSILQYLNWKRSTNTRQNPILHEHVPCEVSEYCEKASKWGMIGSAISWILTRNPFSALAVLLAANPRPASVSAEYAWSQAEYSAKEEGYVLPENGSLRKLACTSVVLFEDVSDMFEGESQDIHCIAHDSEEEERVWCIASSLLKERKHPWRPCIEKHAEETGRTHRTAFDVKADEQGISGTINGSLALFGCREFMQQHAVDCEEYSLEAKRLSRQGYEVCYVAKQTESGLTCLGILVRSKMQLTPEYYSLIKGLKHSSCEVGVIQNSQNVSNDLLAASGIHTAWLELDENQVQERILAMQDQGKQVLWITSRGYESKVKPNVQILTTKQAKKLIPTMEFAHTIQNMNRQHLTLTKAWNVAGAVAASRLPTTAPIINLIGDALTLTMLARGKRVSERYIQAVKSRNTYSQMLAEIAVSSEIHASSESVPWYAMSKQNVLEQYGVLEQQGLQQQQLSFLKGYFGPNEMSAKKRKPWIMAFLGQFKAFTPLILLSASALAMITGGVFDGLVMMSILIANAVIGTLQEQKAEQVMDAVNQLQPTRCRVIRDGQEYEIPATELVPGDIVNLEAGDRVPADIRILNAWNLQANESTLTGESLPVDKQGDAVDENLGLADRTNMIYLGTDITSGKCSGIVVATGMHTEMGHLMSLMKDDPKEVTPLQQKVTNISKTFFKGAMLAGGLVFLTGIVRGVPLTQLITTSITLAASAVPEGLPVTITIALSAGIYRMAKKNALIRKLSALETLGRTTVICTDKTGTLTKNEMTIQTVSTVNKTWLVTGNGYEPTGTITEVSSNEVAATTPVAKAENFNGETVDLQRLIQIGVLCNNSKLEFQEGRWVVKGDPTEGALLSLAEKSCLQEDNWENWNRCHEIPFDSSTGSMSVVCKEVQLGQECYLFTKGSIESVLERCSFYQENGQVYPLTEEMKAKILHQNEQFAAQALRVLGFAYREIDWDADDLCEDNLIYVGLTGMMDPPKPDVEKSIRDAYSLGVKPVMITGDHPITAIAIAKQLGIWDGHRDVLSGYEIDGLTDEELAAIVENTCIFARVTPEHKLRIVNAFQMRGHIVTMTGDGVNDTPAIKKANVGIAMGITGTDVTKQTADMILKQDHFASIVEGVKEGRTIIGNIRKAIGCLLTGNLAEIFVTATAVIMGLPIPLIPIQILLMNVLTDALPAIVLAINPGNKKTETKLQDIVDTPLYHKVITRGLLLGVGSLGVFATSLALGAPMAVAQTSAFVTLVVGQLLQTLSWKHEGVDNTSRQDWKKDRYLIGALGASFAALLAIIYIPPFARIFHTAPLTLQQWIPVLLVAGSISWLADPILKGIAGFRKQVSETKLNLQPV